MYQTLGRVDLKGGESVEAGVVIGPDAEWADRVGDLLSHKGDVWRWQNGECLRRDLGIEVRFYLLHRDGTPLANMLTVTQGGVGHFGHVYTRPEERRKGAAKSLMRLLMEDFRQQQGRALFLGTGYDSAPFHIYQGEGFCGLEPGSGRMEYYVNSAEAFRRDWFAPGPVEVHPVSWENWPTSAPLFTGPFPGTVRCAPLGLFGRASTERGWLQLLHDDRSQGLVLRQQSTGAIVGAAVAGDHPLWPQTGLVDVYCHPDFWEWGAELLGALERPQRDRWLACSDDGCPAKESVLAAAGFTSTQRAARRIAVDTAKSAFADVLEWQE
ncbi:MAG: GNAT family N-acetyltransferase [bacterium]|nr:GNAT family N-acetyltransferase [bacterium]